MTLFVTSNLCATSSTSRCVAKDCGFRKTSAVGPSGRLLPNVSLISALEKLVASKPSVSTHVSFFFEFSQLLTVVVPLWLPRCCLHAAHRGLQSFRSVSVSGVMSSCSSNLSHLTCKHGLGPGGALLCCSACFNVVSAPSRFRCLRLIQICLPSSLGLCAEISFSFYYPIRVRNSGPFALLVSVLKSSTVYLTISGQMLQCPTFAWHSFFDIVSVHLSPANQVLKAPRSQEAHVFSAFQFSLHLCKTSPLSRRCVKPHTSVCLSFATKIGSTCLQRLFKRAPRMSFVRCLPPSRVLTGVLCTAVAVPLAQLIFPSEDLETLQVRSRPLVFVTALSPPPPLH